ncbi:hypothetical protein FIBSPDRAFT_964337 [Athelia psychrophila]|uniref:Amino acid transporter transmembrane domain-containing protein n=1 Tax=Athelia psychrophila TaxID=1759441 RepID=A0A165XX83_9AGAM|nr:hypothetical protein FIBSPDRAFT_964337 [Fibularhizoctonia sp. CBS 109695]
MPRTLHQVLQRTSVERVRSRSPHPHPLHARGCGALLPLYRRHIPLHWEPPRVYPSRTEHTVRLTLNERVRSRSRRTAPAPFASPSRLRNYSCRSIDDITRSPGDLPAPPCRALNLSIQCAAAAPPSVHRPSPSPPRPHSKPRCACTLCTGLTAAAEPSSGSIDDVPRSPGDLFASPHHALNASLQRMAAAPTYPHAGPMRRPSRLPAAPALQTALAAAAEPLSHTYQRHMRPHRAVVTQARVVQPFEFQVTGILQLYGGAMISTKFVAEMRKPMDFWKGMACAQVLITPVYMVFGVVVYSYHGQFVVNPANQGISGYAWQTATNVISLTAGSSPPRSTATLASSSNPPPPPAGHLQEDPGRTAWVLCTLVYWVLVFVVRTSIPQVSDISLLVSANKC